MINSHVIIDNIKSLSPGKEKWAGKPIEEIPKRVTVNFKAGQQGLLEMANPRHAHWADLIDRYEKSNKALYIEIDKDTNVITNLLIPDLYKVHSLQENEFGDYEVSFIISSTMHLLLKSNPKFEEMLAALQDAKDNDKELLVTETRDEHEIIDIRPPIIPSENPENPPQNPPPDPPVTEQRATELFDDMNALTCDPCNPSADCIPFKYPDNGCWARAHKMAYLMDQDGEDPEKVWISGSLHAASVNHPDCIVNWAWHVAPTLMVTTGSGDVKHVIDPSLSDKPLTVTDWKNLQSSTASLNYTAWTDFYGGSTDPNCVQTDIDLQTHRDKLKDRCLDIGPPPYSCNKNCHFIVDRSTFSEHEIDAMLSNTNPAVIEDAFYVVLDGFKPHDLGIVTPTMSYTPTVNVSPSASGMTLEADRLVFEYPAFLNRRQRMTWVFKIKFANTSAFTAESRTINLSTTISASGSSVTGNANIYLIKQPNPYEIDGETSWLSTDLRVFQIKQGDPKFGETMGADPNTFISNVITRLNTGNTSGESFDANISTNQQTSKLELSQQVNGVNVYNFAVAKVRYRALNTSATNVRVFFRLFPVATTSVNYNQGTTYRRHEQGGDAIPLLGISGGNLVSIPCFASPRINSGSASMTTQTDTPNVQTIPPNASGQEVVQYFGCWLDINQQQVQFPEQPSGDGPYSNRKSIQTLIKNAHQCLVSEIAFDPAPIPAGLKPSTSDKLAQRNLAIVESANPGYLASRRIPHTFEIRPTASKIECDELLIDWGNLPEGSQANIYMPGISAYKVMQLAFKKYRSHKLAYIDEYTLKCETGGITYIPIPVNMENVPGLLTIDLPGTVKKGESYKVVVRQVTGQSKAVAVATTHMTNNQAGWRHILGSFQLTIPVLKKEEMLESEQRKLSNLRWIEKSLTVTDRWYLVFKKYVQQNADRVDALGGDSGKIVGTPTGEWQKAYKQCRLLAFVVALFLAILVIAIGVFPGNLQTIGDIPAFALFIIFLFVWIKKCKPGICRLLKVLFAGTGTGALLLAVYALLGNTAPNLINTIIVGGIVAVGSLIIGLLKKCFKRS